MAGSVLYWTFDFQINISAKLKVSASKSATSPSCKTLLAMLSQHTVNKENWPNLNRIINESNPKEYIRDNL